MTRNPAHHAGRPAGGPWWRFVPPSSAVGYAAMAVAFVLLVQALAKLFDSARHPVPVLALEGVVAVVSVAWLAQSADGLRILHRRRAGRR